MCHLGGHASLRFFDYIFFKAGQLFAPAWTLSITAIKRLEFNKPLESSYVLMCLEELVKTDGCQYS